jgi:ATP-dependent RNA helicase SUPV3L1/SUV3
MEAVFLPDLLKPKAVALRAVLWALRDGGERRPAPPAPGLVTVPADARVPESFYAAVGFRVLGGRAVRIDMLDRVAILMAGRMRKGPFPLDAELLTPLGLSVEQMAPIVSSLGYRVTVAEEGGATVEGRVRRPPRRERPAPAAPAAAAPVEADRKPKRPPRERKPGGKKPEPRPRRERPIDPDSPFAKLAELRFK